MNKKIGNLDRVEEETKEDVTKRLAKDLSEYFLQNKDKGIKTLFLSSGGSALSVLGFISNNILGDYLTIGVLDERYDKTNETNNFTQLTKTEFYKKAKDAGCYFINTSVKHNQSQAELAEYFDREIKDWKNKNSDGEIVATVGVGPDGHTSGVMPFPEDKSMFEELFEGESLVVAYNATGKNPCAERVTTTITFLRSLDRVFVLMTGVDKHEAFLKIEKEGSVAQIPARILKELKGTIYVDEEVLKG